MSYKFDVFMLLTNKEPAGTRVATVEFEHYDDAYNDGVVLQHIVDAGLIDADVTLNDVVVEGDAVDGLAIADRQTGTIFFHLRPVRGCCGSCSGCGKNK